MKKIILSAPGFKWCSSLLVAICIVFTTVGQVNSYPPMVRKLASVNKTVHTTPLEIRDQTVLFPVPAPFHQNRIQLIKSPGPLYALVRGTGQVYRLDTTGKVPQWIRIDSTYFAGYNFRSINFWMDNTLYSYGGTGLWNTNGGLRYYVPEKFEWEIALVDREIPHMFEPVDFYYLDTTNKALYLLGIHSHNATLDNNNKLQEEIGNRIWKLDLQERKWTELGKTKDTSLLVLGNSPWGMFYVNTTKPGIADFVNNRYLEAKHSAEVKFAKYFKSGPHKTMAFFIDSTFYFGNHSHYLDSIPFSLSEFVDTGIPIYSKVLVDGRKIMNWLPWVLLAIVLGIMFHFYAKYRKIRSYLPNGIPPNIADVPIAENNSSEAYAYRSATSPVNKTKGDLISEQVISPLQEVKPLLDSKNKPLVFHPNLHQFKLDDREKAVLQFILEQSQNMRVVTIEELNKILGVSNKSPEIQKRQRSDTLIAINQKLIFLTGLTQPVIEKRRSESDKRSFEFYIHPDNFEKVRNCLI